MGDSDEDNDRRRRDRFARERNDYRDRGREYERDPYGRGGRGDYGRDYDRRRAFSPLRNPRDVSPPAKRSRYESESGPPSQPAMMTFKQFLSTQDDSIDDEVAIKKYAEYKADFKRQQLEDFFKNHKDEEWFRLKYHPDECDKRKAELQANIEKRLEVYGKVKDLDLLDNVVLDVDKNNENIIRLMDSVAIFLEGGDEFDLKALDEPEPVVAPQTLEPITKPVVEEPKKDADVSENDEAKDDEESKEPKEDKPEEKEQGEESDAESKPAEEAKEEGDAEEKIEGAEKEPEEKKPRHLHRTSSIFLRTLCPAITKQEVEAMCRNYPGFLRVALAEPQPERKFLRRGWVTFERNVNTKEICWKLNNIRLRDTELGAILNRDLLRRVRSVNGITCAKQVMRSDIKLAARIMQNLDTQRGLHMVNGESKNPLLTNITDYLIEEACAEEEELLGGNVDELKNENGSCAERDAELAKVLDRLLLYLRIVHSMDYYAHSEYPNEDEMPNRCGIIHARGSLPTSSVSPQEIEDYIANFTQKCATYVEHVLPLTQEECQKLGLKTEEEELEKFMSKNCQQLDKDKFLCPLSGKKFKAPEFVHKHIQNRHGDKIEEVKKDAVYYNNYIMDPKRPSLPEHPSTKMRQQGNGSGPGHDPMASGPYGHYAGPGPYGYPPPGRPNYGPSGGYPMRGYPPPDNYRYGNRRGGGGGFGGGGPRGVRDPRPVVSYNDLDGPPDFDMF